MSAPLSDREAERTLAAHRKANGSPKEAARLLGLPESTFRSRMMKLQNRDGGKPPVKDKPVRKTRHKKTAAGTSLEDLLSRHDPHTRAREAIRVGITLLEDRRVLRDAEFRQELCGMNAAGCWRTVASEEEFLRYQFTLDNKVWWSTLTTVEEVVERIAKAKLLG